MKKNGFTLVELLAVIALLAIMLLVAIPQVTKTMQKSEIQKEETFKKDIELAAQSYVEDNWTKRKADFVLKNCVSIQTLIDTGYVSPLTKNPSYPNQSIAEYSVKLINQANGANYRFSYQYSTDTCN